MGLVANSTTITFGSQISRVRSISFGETAAEVDVTNLSSSLREYLNGLKDISVTVEVFGVNSTAIGATGALSIAWADAGADSLGNAICLGNECSGEVDGAITSTLTFRPTPA